MSQRVLLQLIHWRTDNDYMTTRLHYVNIDLHRQCGVFSLRSRPRVQRKSFLQLAVQAS